LKVYWFAPLKKNGAITLKPLATKFHMELILRENINDIFAFCYKLNTIRFLVEFLKNKITAMLRDGYQCLVPMIRSTLLAFGGIGLNKLYCR